MGTGSMGIVGAQSAVLTVGTTIQYFNIGFKTTTIMLRAPSGNTQNITIGIGAFDVLGGSIIVRPAESISVDISNILLLKKAMGLNLTDDDFISRISAIAGGAGQTLYLDAIGAV
jgi:hypothetical protein